MTVTNKVLAQCHLNFPITPVPRNNVFKPAGQPNTTTRASLLKLNQPLRRTNHGQRNIS